MSRIGGCGAAIDDSARQMPQEIDDEWARQPLERLAKLRPDAGQRGYRRKKPVEDGGTHKTCLYREIGTAKHTE